MKRLLSILLVLCMAAVSCGLAVEIRDAAPDIPEVSVEPAEEASTEDAAPEAEIEEAIPDVAIENDEDTAESPAMSNMEMLEAEFGMSAEEICDIMGKSAEEINAMPQDKAYYGAFQAVEKSVTTDEIEKQLTADIKSMTPAGGHNVADDESVVAKSTSYSRTLSVADGYSTITLPSGMNYYYDDGNYYYYWSSGSSMFMISITEDDLMTTSEKAYIFRNMFTSGKYYTTRNNHNVLLYYNSGYSSKGSYISIYMYDAGDTTVTLISAATSSYALSSVRSSIINSITVKSQEEEDVYPFSKKTLAVGESYTPDNGGDYDETYSSSKTSVATVSSTGTIKGKKAGTAKITVKYPSGKKQTVTITVKKAATKVKINKSKATVKVGKTVQLKATVTGYSSSLTWSSSNKKVATVNSNGKVTAVKKGSATITVKTFNGKKATCTITVK